MNPTTVNSLPHPSLSYQHPEIHEGNIGGQKTRAYFANQGSK